MNVTCIKKEVNEDTTIMNGFYITHYYIHFRYRIDLDFSLFVSKEEFDKYKVGSKYEFNYMIGKEVYDT